MNGSGQVRERKASHVLVHTFPLQHEKTSSLKTIAISENILARHTDLWGMSSSFAPCSARNLSMDSFSKKILVFHQNNLVFQKRAISEHVNVCVLTPTLWTRIRLCQTRFILSRSVEQRSFHEVLNYPLPMPWMSVGSDWRSSDTSEKILCRESHCRCGDDRNSDRRTDLSNSFRNFGFLGSWKIEKRLSG